MKFDLSNPAWRQTLPPGRAVAGDAPVAACAFSKDGSIAAFALGDGRVRLLPADLKETAAAAAEPVHKGVVLSLIADPAGDGFVSGGDDGRLLRIAADGTASEIANQKGKWFEHVVAHRATGAIAASAGNRRTRPSPRAKATVAPSLLKAQAAAGASAATERPGGRVWCQAGFERSSFTSTSGSR